MTKVDKAQERGAVGSPLDGGVGRPVPERAESLREMIARLERQQFDEWAKANGFGKSLATTWAWQAWQARGALQAKCRGVAHHGCNYLAACGGVCNKCGQSV